MAAIIRIVVDKTGTPSTKRLVWKYGHTDFTGQFDTDTQEQLTITTKLIIDLRKYIVYWHTDTETFEQGTEIEYISPEIAQHLTDNQIWTDSVTDKKGPPIPMLAFHNEREINNNPDNPLYISSGFTPMQTQIGTLNSLHAGVKYGSGGWHQKQIEKSLYTGPKKLLIYYGWPYAFNSAQNGWDWKKVSDDMVKYDQIVFGNTLQEILTQGTHTGSGDASTLTDSTKSWSTDEFVGKIIINTTDGSIGTITANSSTTITATLSGGTENDWDNGDAYIVGNHADIGNFWRIIQRLKLLKPSIQLFGYVTVNQSYSNFETKADDWNTLGVTGVFMDEAGWDYGDSSTNGREAFNDKVDHVHGLSSANVCFVNAWTIDNILSSDYDATWNPDSLDSNLIHSDWYLLESFPINDAAYTASTPDGYEPKADWVYRGIKATGYRYSMGINLAACGIITNSNSIGQQLFDFGFISALMWALDSFGTSDIYYAASSAAVKYWRRNDQTPLGKIYELSPSIQVNLIDSDLYQRYVEHAELRLDFSDSNAQKSEIAYHQGVLPYTYGPKSTSEMELILNPKIGDTCFNTDWKKLAYYDGDIWLCDQIIKFTNNSGGTLSTGDVVILHQSSSESVNTTTTASDINVLGVIVKGGDDSEFVSVAIKGIWDVLVTATTAIGDGLYASTTAGSASPNTNGSVGVFAQAVAVRTGAGLVKAMICGTEAT
ncbi:MAG: hypothetical protein BV456_03105 [Thermoplasmata archaeon M8B2D]|nr:MAG: hypothetical protein BV456_03105 [Thermoplasmata archaeon M8B2D]